MKTLKSYLAAGALALAAFGPGSANAALEVLNEGFGAIGGETVSPADLTGWRISPSVEGEGRFAFRHVGYANTLNHIGLGTVRVVTAVPEPSLYVMLALGLGALSFMRRKPSI